jgi:hypothetical protein
LWNGNKYVPLQRFSVKCAKKKAQLIDSPKIMCTFAAQNEEIDNYNNNTFKV